MSWYNNVPTENVLDSWVKHKYNVCLHGRHGVGKTTMVFDAFHRANWQIGRDYLYFSAATIDPWVDLIGVPARVKNEAGEEVLKLIRPENINSNTIKAFFVDEFNRSHKKVRNAMMELIQFKSINGLKFPNLEFVWAAVNPDDDTELKFDVEKLDPAQEDRFQIHVQIPYKPSQAFFAERFNDPDMAEAVCKWWNDQPDKVKLEITPRRLEYAIDVFQKTHELRYVVPAEAHVPSLKMAIQSGNPEKTLGRMIAEGNEDEMRRWLAVENNLNGVQNIICTDRSIAQKVLHLLSDERLTAFACKHKAIQDQLKAEPKKYARAIKDLAENATQKLLKDMCQKLLPYIEVNGNSLANAKVSVRPLSQLTITKRRKAELFENYSIRTGSAVKTITPTTLGEKERVELIMALVTDSAFATNTHGKQELLTRMAKAISSDMPKSEADVCIKILEHIASYTNEPQSLDIILKDHLTTIQSVVVSWAKHNGTKVEDLFKAAPYLVANVLSMVADKETQPYLALSELVLLKTGSKAFESVPAEQEYANGQSLNEVLGF